MEARVEQLVRKMHAKTPSDKALTGDVCMAVLRRNYSADPALSKVADWEADIAPVVRRVLAILQPASSAAAAATTRPSVISSGGSATRDEAESSSTASAESTDDDEEDDEEDESEGETNGESYDSEGEAESGSDDEESDDDDDDFDSGEDEESDEGEEDGAAEKPPAAKKHRSETTENGSDEHTIAMVSFAKKLRLNPRQRAEGESWADYRTQYLDGLFGSKQLDASDLSKEAASRFRMREELALLQEECDVSLDRRARRGRASFLNAPAEAPKAASGPSSLFDDDDE